MKLTAIATITAGALIGAAIIFSGSHSSGAAASAPAHNVSIVDGIQIVEITAKGGYEPQRSVAKAGIPTILRFKTDGAYDCSSSIRIPNLNYSTALPATGSTDVDVKTPQAGALRGTCGMGMFSFEVDFES
jgi:plastocyanin domain-containing protein